MKFLTIATAVLSVCSLAQGEGVPAPKLQVAEWLQQGPVKIGPGQIFVIDLWGPDQPVERNNPSFLNGLSKEGGPTVVAITLADPDAVRTYLKREGDEIPRYAVALDSERKTTEAYRGYMKDRQPGESCCIIDKNAHFVWFGLPRDAAKTVAAIEAGTYSVDEFLKAREDRKRGEELVKRYIDGVLDGVDADDLKPTVDEIFAIGARRPETLVALARIIMIAPGLKSRDTALAQRAAQEAWVASEKKDARAALFFAKALRADGKLARAKKLLEQALPMADATHKGAIELEFNGIKKEQEEKRAAGKGAKGKRKGKKKKGDEGNDEAPKSTSKPGS